MIAISYRREDTLAVTGRLYDRLQAKFGKRNVFMDFDQRHRQADPAVREPLTLASEFRFHLRDIPTELIVDQSETTMEWQESGKRKGVAKAYGSGDTLSASFPAGLTVGRWSLAAQPDGTTARVRLQAFMNDQTAVFRRVAAEPRAPKSAR